MPIVLQSGTPNLLDVQGLSRPVLGLFYLQAYLLNTKVGFAPTQSVVNRRLPGMTAMYHSNIRFQIPRDTIDKSDVTAIRSILEESNFRIHTTRDVCIA